MPTLVFLKLLQIMAGGGVALLIAKTIPAGEYGKYNFILNISTGIGMALFLSYGTHLISNFKDGVRLQSFGLKEIFLISILINLIVLFAFFKFSLIVFTSSILLTIVTGTYMFLEETTVYYHKHIVRKILFSNILLKTFFILLAVLFFPTYYLIVISAGIGILISIIIIFKNIYFLFGNICKQNIFNYIAISASNLLKFISNNLEFYLISIYFNFELLGNFSLAKLILISVIAVFWAPLKSYAIKNNKTIVFFLFITGLFITFILKYFIIDAIMIITDYKYEHLDNMLEIIKFWIPGYLLVEYYFIKFEINQLSYVKILSILLSIIIFFIPFALYDPITIDIVLYTRMLAIYLNILFLSIMQRFL